MKHARDDYNRIQDPAGKIPADEPVFLLRGQDQLACEAVAFYASLCEKHQAPEIAAKARAHAKAMADWPTKKIPDLTATNGESRADRIRHQGRSMSDALRQAAERFLAAADAYSEDTFDEVALMIEYGEAHKALRATLAAQAPQAGQEMDAKDARDAVIEAARDWSAERDIKDWDEAALMKAVWTLGGDQKACEGCDGECGEPCAPCTVEQAHAMIDAHLAKLVKAGKLFDGTIPMEPPKSPDEQGPILSDEWIEEQWAKSSAQNIFPALTHFTAAVEKAARAAIAAQGAQGTGDKT